MQHQNPATCIQVKTKTIHSRFNYPALLQWLEEKAIEEFGKSFFMADEDRDIWVTLIAWALKDTLVADEIGLNLYKGILLTGPVGCGKTTLMRCIQWLVQDERKHHLVSCRHISTDAAIEGYGVVQRYARHCFYPYSKLPQVICFDDLGLETMAMHYGNTINTMAEILLSRYDLFKSHHMLTHITTNLNSQELEAIYGNRLRSRFREMFNLVAYPKKAGDKRK